MADKTEKAKDAEKRQKEESRRETFDSGDRFAGWDAQQGALPPRDEDDLYAEDPVVYSEDQLPDPEVLEKAGYRPVMPEHRIAGNEGLEGEKLEVAEHDGGPLTASNVDEGQDKTEQPERESDDDEDDDEDEDKKDDDSGKKKVSKKSSKKK